MKSLKEITTTIFSNKSVGIFIFIFSTIILTLLLSSRYYLHHSIIENGVSKRDVIATRTIKIEDTEKTDKLKNEISKKVLPILVPIQDDFIKNNLDKNLETVDAIKSSNSSNDEKLNELILYFNLSEDNAIDIPNLEYLLKISNRHYDKIKIATKNTTLKILENGISENDIQDNFDKILKENTSKYLSSSDYALLTFFVKGVIAPNIVTDEEATEMARKSAINSVKPVETVYKAGSKIVSAGQLVSKVQRDALKKSGYNVIQLNFSGIMGILLLVIIALSTCAYEIEHQESNFKKKSYYALIGSMMILLVIFAIALPNHIGFLPVVAFTMILGIFLNNRVALICTISILCATALALQLDITLTVIYIFGAFATVYSLNTITYSNRMELARIGVASAIVYALGATGAFFLEYNFEDISFATYGNAILIIIGNGLLSSIFAIGILPILEAIFKITTPYGLMELANSNNPLLLKLQEKAPGTHHHSQMVAILAEAAAESIGANSILTRVGALYHDVGKINRPLFFFENQSYYGIENPHEQFSPKFSKMVITTHPRDGVEIAKEYGISSEIHPFILEHHGDSIVSYFYNEAVKNEGAENVSKDEYRYNAPRPSSKETAIVMLADGVESAVRSLKNASFDEINAKVTTIIKSKLMDEQLSDSPLTLKDLKIIEATFNRILKGMHHQRIKYHEDLLKGQNSSETEGNNNAN